MLDFISFLTLVDRYCAHRRLSDARVSTLIFNDGARIATLRAGTGEIGVKRLARAILWLSENWPDGAEWPSEIPRPTAHSDKDAAA